MYNRNEFSKLSWLPCVEHEVTYLLTYQAVCRLSFSPLETRLARARRHAFLVQRNAMRYRFDRTLDSFAICCCYIMVIDGKSLVFSSIGSLEVTPKEMSCCHLGQATQVYLAKCLFRYIDVWLYAGGCTCVSAVCLGVSSTRVPLCWLGYVRACVCILRAWCFN